MLSTQSAIHDLVRDQRWSAAELARQIHARAGVLARFIEPGKDNMFVIAHGNSCDFFADLFAVWQVGGTAACVNAGLTGTELETVVEFTSPRAVLVDAADVSASVPVLRTADERTTDDKVEVTRGSLDQAALMLFTSGTTGDPKGVVHTHRSLLARLALNLAEIGADDLERSLCVLPTHFGHGLIGNCLTPLAAGGTVYLFHGAGLKGTSQLGAHIDDHQITFMSSVPAFWKLALRVSEAPGSNSLRRVHVGSAPLADVLWHNILDWCGTQRVVNMYGITETANWVGGASATDFDPEDGLIGTLWGGSAAVLNADGNLVPQGSGELHLRVPSLMTGYYRRPDLTDAVLKDGWYATGDVGRIDEASVLRLTGRSRYVINRAGMKVYPEELDLLTERHPAIAEACAFAMADDASGEAVGLAVSLRAEAELDSRELLAWLKERIRAEAMPNRVFVVDDIPKTDRGKLNRDNVAQFCSAEPTS